MLQTVISPYVKLMLHDNAKAWLFVKGATVMLTSGMTYKTSSLQHLFHAPRRRVLLAAVIHFTPKLISTLSHVVGTTVDSYSTAVFLSL